MELKSKMDAIFCYKLGRNFCDGVSFERSKWFLGPRSWSEVEERFRQFFEFLFFENVQIVQRYWNKHSWEFYKLFLFFDFCLFDGVWLGLISDEIFKCVDCCVVQRQLLEIVCIVVYCAKVKNVSSLFRTQIFILGVMLMWSSGNIFMKISILRRCNIMRA